MTKNNDMENQWPRILPNPKAIADYMQEHGDVSWEWVFEYFHGAMAVLKEVDVASLTPGNPDANISNIEKELLYEKLPIRTMPPLVVENNTVMDGNHRLRVLKRKQVEKALVYDVVELNPTSLNEVDSS